MTSSNKLIGIVAMTSDGVIAIDGKLPVKSKEDMAFFKEMTTGQNVIMGRKTFESIGSKPLPNRKNIVITRGKLETPYKEVYFTNSYLNALRSIAFENDRDVFIIGGAQIYRDMLPLCDEIYVTVFFDTVLNPTIDKEYTYFPYGFNIGNCLGRPNFINGGYTVGQLDLIFETKQAIHQFEEIDPFDNLDNKGVIYKFSRYYEENKHDV